MYFQYGNCCKLHNFKIRPVILNKIIRWKIIPAFPYHIFRVIPNKKLISACGKYPFDSYSFPSW